MSGLGNRTGNPKMVRKGRPVRNFHWWEPVPNEQVMNKMADMMERVTGVLPPMPYRFYMTPAVYWEVPDRPWWWHRLWARLFLGWRWKKNAKRIQGSV